MENISMKFKKIFDGEWEYEVKTSFCHNARMYIRTQDNKNYSPCIYITPKEGGNECAVMLNMAKSFKEAKAICLDWLKNYKPATAQEAIDNLSSFGRTNIWNTRNRVLNQLFFVTGSGYRWVDGTLLNGDQEDHDFSHWDEQDKRLQESISNLREIEKKYGLINTFDHIDERKKKDEMELYEFSRISRYSDICNVPDDVRDDWLDLAYEAAILLRDKSDVDLMGHAGTENLEERKLEQLKNKEKGADIVKDLEKRFPQLKK